MMQPGDVDQLRSALTTDGALDRVSAAIAQVDPNAPPLDDIVAELDRLAAGITDTSPQGLLKYVFGTLSFVGNQQRYYLPANSLIHRVLETRMGNPLSLSIVAVELSRRVGGTMTVIGFPGHVLIGEDDHPSRWFDPFLGGAPMDLAGCRSLLARMRPGEAFHPAMVRPSTGEETAARILNNLDVAYRQSGDLARLADVGEMRLGLPVGRQWGAAAVGPYACSCRTCVSGRRGPGCAGGTRSRQCRGVRGDTAPAAGPAQLTTSPSEGRRRGPHPAGETRKDSTYD